MKLLKSATAAVAVAGVALGGVLFSGPASADPVAPTGGLVVTGSDTLQASMDALTNGTNIGGANVRVSYNGLPISNFDAFGSDVVQTKPFGPLFNRPSGSGDGLKSMVASLQGNTFAASTYTNLGAVAISGQVDIGRSSDAPSNGTITAGQHYILTYVPYARDAVSYAYLACGTDSPTALASLTKDELAQIYSATAVGAGTTVNGVVVEPRLPQGASGTRKFFLKVLNNSTTTQLTLHGAVNETLSATTQENDARMLTCDPEGDNYSKVIPFSAAAWISQANGANKPNTITGTGVQLGSPNGVAPFTGSGSSLVPNDTFYAATSVWGRDTYLIASKARLASDPAYAALFDKDGGTSSFVSFGTAINQPGKVKQKFGFLAPASTDLIDDYAVNN